MYLDVVRTGFPHQAHRACSGSCCTQGQAAERGVQPHTTASVHIHAHATAPPAITAWSMTDTCTPTHMTPRKGELGQEREPASQVAKQGTVWIPEP